MCPHSTVVPSGVVAREVSSESGSTERPPSLTHEAHTTEGGWVGGVVHACMGGMECGLCIVHVSSLCPVSHKTGNVCGVVCYYGRVGRCSMVAVLLHTSIVCMSPNSNTC